MWRYQLHPTRSGGSWLVESVECGTAASPLTERIADVPDKEEQVVAARCAEHLRNITATLHAIKATAERLAAEKPAPAAARSRSHPQHPK